MMRENINPQSRSGNRALVRPLIGRHATPADRPVHQLRPLACTSQPRACKDAARPGRVIRVRLPDLRPRRVRSASCTGRCRGSSMVCLRDFVSAHAMSSYVWSSSTPTIPNVGLRASECPSRRGGFPPHLSQTPPCGITAAGSSGAIYRRVQAWVIRDRNSR